MSQPAELILASASLRRRQLLAEAGYRFRVVEPSLEAECEAAPGESPAAYAARMAGQKASDVAPRISSGLLIACDTVVDCDGQILGKPRDERDARRMLELLSGRSHAVVSGLCLWPLPGGEPWIETARTTLEMRPLSPGEIREYLSDRLWVGKAGGFGYQDRLGWLTIVEGSESNVVGLPLELLAEMLEHKTGQEHQG